MHSVDFVPKIVNVEAHRKKRIAAFWDGVNQDGPVPDHRPDLGPCWVWTRALVVGYGVMYGFHAKPVKVHRFSYGLLVGPIPEGLEIDHLCRNRACCNPAHLEPVTGRENKLRGATVNAKNAAKTHCIRGHPFDRENTYLSPQGKRQCKACSVVIHRRYREAARTRARAAA